MGRQIAFIMSEADETLFLKHLHGVCKYRLVEALAKSKGKLLRKNFSSLGVGYRQYFIWNRSFKMKKEYTAVANGKFYSLNKKDEHGQWYPLIEVVRQRTYVDVGTAKTKDAGYGRLWVDTARGKYLYDKEELIRFYEKLAAWIKQTASGNVSEGGHVTYFLPGAWEEYRSTHA